MSKFNSIGFSIKNVLASSYYFRAINHKVNVVIGELDLSLFAEQISFHIYNFEK
jgi:hypothetical protein